MKNDTNFRPGLSTPEHTVFEVDCGEMLPEEAIKFLERVRDTFPKKYVHKKESK